MAENSKIEWCRHTFNPVVGCTKVSAACDHCYAEGWAKRAGHPELWTGERRRTSPANWRQPFKWNAAAKAAGERHRVFCASLADVFDNQWEPQWRADLWDLIAACPGLDWLLLTKRPQNIAKMLPARWGDGWPHVWLGATCESGEQYRLRYPHLARIPAVIRFISYEPALSPIVLNLISPPVLQPDWIICGGESGGHARTMDPEWARHMRDQCDRHGIAFFMKQMTKKAPIPDDLMVRQFPRGP